MQVCIGNVRFIVDIVLAIDGQKIAKRLSVAIDKETKT